MPGRLMIDDWTRHAEMPAFQGDPSPILTPNAAPRRWLSILRHEPGAGSTSPTRLPLLREAFWGLTPDWLEVLDHAPHCARAETLDERPMFRDSLDRRRCLVPVGGVYVWQAGLRGKQPFLITHARRAPLLLAGIWTRHAPGSQTSRDSFALITVAAPECLTPLSDRLPAIISSAQAPTWLDEETAHDSVRALLHPASDDLLGAFPVSRSVNDPKQQSWSCAHPTGPMRPARQPASP